MKTAYNHLTHSYETPDKTSVAAEICEGDTPSDAFRAAAVREQQRKSAAYARTVIDALYENGDPVSVDAAELLEQITQPSKPLTSQERDAQRWRFLMENSYDSESVTQFHVWEHSWEPHSKTGEPTEWKQRVRGIALIDFIDRAIEAKLREKNA